MQLKELMTQRVEMVHPDSTIQEAADKMKELNVGALPVIEKDHVVGILTDRDITIRVTAEGHSPATTIVSQAMTKNPAFCYEDQTVEEAAQLMEDRQIRRLLVVNHDDQLVGIVSLGDLATHIGNERLISEVLREISEPSEPSF